MEIYPGSVCCLVGNDIHHCKDGILIKVRLNRSSVEGNSAFATSSLSPASI